MATSGLSGWLAGQRAPRIALIAGLFPLPLLGLVSVAIVVLTVQVHGWRVAAADCVAATLVLVGLIMAAGGYWLGLGLGAALAWSVALLLGGLRRRSSLVLPVQVAVLAGVAGALAFNTLAADPLAHWEQVIRELARRAATAGVDLGPTEPLLATASVMTGVVAASAVASAVAALVLGSWWASQLGVGEATSEFQVLRMGAVIGALTVLVAAACLTDWRAIADDLLVVLGAGFAVQGLAVLHWHGTRRGWPRAWVLALYLPMVLLPAIAAAELLALAALGVADNAYSLRRIGANVV
jgi:hypothetical protein